ncbi:MAG: hypothetical protein U5J62_11685 [Desulfurivibrio sp.]|nr:hypothetical protein [Desulfurivibrio sp.]
MQSGHRRQVQDARQQAAQLLLTAGGHQEIPEGAEAFALIGIGDGVPAAHDLLQQLPFGSVPQGHPFPNPAIQFTEIILHFPKVGEQFPGQLQKLLKTIFNRGVVQQWDITSLDLFYLRFYAARRFSSSARRMAGSVSLPVPIWRRRSKMVNKRDSVPIKARSLRVLNQLRALSQAGVRSKWGSSEPEG